MRQPLAQRPAHRLNLLLVPTQPEAIPTQAQAAWGRWVERGWITPDGSPGAELMLPGGFALARLDFPGCGVLYGNRQGGFEARCPRCAAPVVRALGPALARWREGQPPQLSCPECGVPSPLEALHFRPDAAPGRFAVELRDVVSLELPPAVHTTIEADLGLPLRVVLSRGA